MSSSAKSETQVPLHPPDVRRYLQFREYLVDYQSWRQAQGRGFSFQKWADELGVKSRSFLRMVLVGQRSLSEAMLPLFIKGLQLNEPQARYFETLVRFNQAKTHAQREVLGLELMKHVRASRRTEIQNHYAFLSSHLTPRLHVLLTVENIERTPENLARLLGTSERQCLELLEVLRGLKMAAPDESGPGWHATSEQFSVPNHFGDTALRSFHRQSLEEAISALEGNSNDRRYASVLLNLDQSQFEQLQGEVMTFIDQLLGKYGSSRGEGTRLFQLNESLIAVTPVLKEESPETSASSEAPPVPATEKGNA